jgi:protein-serine/threonine kinase
MDTTGSLRGYTCFAYLIRPNQAKTAWVVDKKRAIKVLERASVDNPASNTAEAQREVEVNAMVSNPGHDCVCRFHECAYDHTYLFIVLDFCDDGELFDHVASGAFHVAANPAQQTPRVQQCFQEMMKGLRYLHLQNITHRDMKIENVMLSREAPAKIIDFGLCLRGDVQPQREGGRGTVSFMAPEVHTCQGPWSGFKADIWSCGVVLFMLLTGAPPYELPSDADPRFRMIRDPLQGPGALIDFWQAQGMPALASIPAQARDLLGQMLLADPARRPDAQTVLDHPWLN